MRQLQEQNFICIYIKMFWQFFKRQCLNLKVRQCFWILYETNWSKEFKAFLACILIRFYECYKDIKMNCYKENWQYGTIMHWNIWNQNSIFQKTITYHYWMLPLNLKELHFEHLQVLVSKLNISRVCNYEKFCILKALIKTSRKACWRNATPDNWTTFLKVNGNLKKLIQLFHFFYTSI